jgi:hypothetical protein
MSAGRFLWRTLVATEAAKPGHAMTEQMTSQTVAFAVVGVLEGTVRERVEGNVVAVVLDGLERRPRDA